MEENERLPEEEIQLSGDWSIFSIAEKMPLLMEKLRALSGESRRSPIIDLAAVESIDVSGWQLLAMWLRHCRTLGCEPVMVNIREDLRKRLELLGFDAEFTFRESSKPC